ncbi:MAG: haloacid dehalogenase-like hydrolase [Acidobacteriia bacterium]|nr:haloacid dehalogenase-like hydrolase [Terriglobia bacterium]
MSLLLRPLRSAAFFDLDGTLLPGPALEMRFYRVLRYRGEIGARQMLSWLAEAARLAPRGMFALRHGNKMYLRGVRADAATAFRGMLFQANPECGEEAGRASRAGAAAGATFFPAGLERMVWHARQGHALVLVSGTLQPLAMLAARALDAELRARGCATMVHVRGTRLEEAGGRWTGRLADEALAGAAKARAVQGIAEREGYALEECYAYGNSSEDRWMLEAVGRPVAVNPARKLALRARREGWPILRWEREAERRRGGEAAGQSERTMRRVPKRAGGGDAAAGGPRSAPTEGSLVREAGQGVCREKREGGRAGGSRTCE